MPTTDRVAFARFSEAAHGLVGVEQAKCTVWGSLALGRDPKSPREYLVIHAPSGLVLCRAKGIKNARAAIKEISRYPIPATDGYPHLQNLSEGFKRLRERGIGCTGYFYDPGHLRAAVRAITAYKMEVR